ncbi:MAG TPA: sulfite exporter TauE/SafE family protein [Steroidobacteraceae bacterium]|jgi:hypothetical protein|nr:sulfite exporter TauE/SafE family protein [Steroidobacteraceae bacterium]
MSDVTTGITLSAAFMAGIAGSAHCVVMCGGLAGALSMRNRVATSPVRNAWGDASLYHVGRLGGYAMGGALFGLFGASLQSIVNLPMLATTARVVAGLLVVLAGVKVLFGLNGLAWIERLGARFWRLVQPIARGAASSSNSGRSLLLGLLWGWLPCGLVYSVLLLAALSGSGLRGAGTMLAFGAGTLPAMLSGSVLGGTVSRWLAVRRRRQLGGMALLLFGVWLAWAAIPTAEHAAHNGHPQVLAAIRN